MSASRSRVAPNVVISGRIANKQRSRPVEASDQLIKCLSDSQPQRTRAKRTNVLAEYDPELKYYYLSRRYTLEQVREIMEILFRTGATIKQYGGHIDRGDFKKKLTKAEWTTIAPYFYQHQKKKQAVAVRINGNYTLDPDVVRKEVARNVTATQQVQIMRQINIRPETDCSLSSFVSDRIEVYIPSSNTISQNIPENILRQLPMFSLESLLHQIFKQPDSGKEISGAANIFNLKNLKVLLYRLSNNLARPVEVDRLLDQIMKSGHRSSLKMLFSFNILPVKVTAEHMIPVLLLRQDQDIIESIFNSCGPIPIRWYEHLSRVLPESAFLSDENDEWGDLQTLASKYWSMDLMKFMAHGLESSGTYAATINEAVTLLLSALKHQILPFHSMLMLLPPNMSWDEIEDGYFDRYGKSVLQIEEGASLSEILDLGFRKNLSYITLEAVLKNDIDRACVCFTYTELGFLTDISETLRTAVKHGKCPLIWEALGLDSFHRLVVAALNDCPFGLEYMLYAAYLRKDNGLRELLLELFRSSLGKSLGYGPYFGLGFVKHAVGSENWVFLLTSALRTILSSIDFPPDRFNATYHTFNLGTNNDHSAINDWFNWLLKNGACIERHVVWLYSEKGRYPDHGNLLCYAVQQRMIESSLLLMEHAKNINARSRDGISPLDTVVKLYGVRAVGNKGLKPKERVLLEALLRRGAQPNRQLDYFERLRTEFIDALTKGDINLLTKLWRNRWKIEPEKEDSFEAHIFRDFLLKWHESPPGEQKRQNYMEKFIAGLKSEGLEWYPTRSIDIRDISCGVTRFYEIQIYNVLQVLAVIADPVLLKEAFVYCYDEAIAELKHSHEFFANLSPLQIAAIQGNLECVKILLKMGADPQEPVRSQYPGTEYTALHYAIKHGHLNITQCLLEHGARVCSPYPNPVEADIPEGPVELAVRLGRLDFLGLLLQVDLNARGEALLAARKHSQIHMTAWIEQYWMGMPQHEGGDGWIYSSYAIQRPPHTELTGKAIEHFSDHQDVDVEEEHHLPNLERQPSSSDEESSSEEMDDDLFIRAILERDTCRDEEFYHYLLREIDIRVNEEPVHEEDSCMDKGSDLCVPAEENSVIDGKPRVPARAPEGEGFSAGEALYSPLDPLNVASWQESIGALFPDISFSDLSIPEDILLD